MNKSEGHLVHGRFSVVYRIYGDSPRVLVCVNGAQQTMASWRSAVRRFSDDFKVVTFDFPGQGQSLCLDGRPGLTFAEQIGILERVAHATSAIPGAVFGASWGSLVAAGYAARGDAKVTKLILAGFGMRHTAALSSLISSGQQLVREGRHSRLGPMIIDGFGASLPEAWKRMIISQFNTMAPQQALAFLEHSKLVAGISDVRELIAFSAIRAETLVINGAEDNLIDLADLETAHRLIPRCTTRIVPDVGHFLHLQEPRVLDEYHAFLVAGECVPLASECNFGSGPAGQTARMP